MLLLCRDRGSPVAAEAGLWAMGGFLHRVCGEAGDSHLGSGEEL